MTPIPPRMPLEYAGSSRPIAPHSAVIPHGPRVATCDGIKACQEIQCDLYGSWVDMDDLLMQCREAGDYSTLVCSDELMAFAECGVTAVACA